MPPKLRDLLQAAMRPVGSYFTPYNQETQTLQQIANAPQSVMDQHPMITSLRRGAAKAELTLADMLSPAFLATAGAGALAQGTGRLALIGQGALRASGAGYGAMGAADLARNAPQAIQGDKGAALSSLLDLAQIVGGAAGLKAKTPIQAGLAEAEEDYRGMHRAPHRETGSPAHDLTETYPDDIYGPKAAQYYGHYGQNDPADVRSVKLVQSLRGKPDTPIEIYRAVPKDLADGQSINPGDWVTISKQYAVDHGDATLGGDYQILKKTVRAKDIFTNGDSIHEWGYDPQQ